MASNEVRIIGGKWRGRKLAFPDRGDLRPTLGRVRETLFNWLRADIAGSRCLDLYAGSGALGFEAASRGAAAVTLVDSDRLVCRRLRDNVERFDAGGTIHVAQASARAFLRRGLPRRGLPRRGLPAWDIIFLDPPFRHGALAAILSAIAAAEALAADGLIYVEGPRHEPLPTAGWREVRHGQAGDTRFGLLASP